MTVTPDTAAQLISDLVVRESVTPWLVPGGAGEGAVVAYLADWLADLPVEVEITEVAPGRPNLLATLRGTGGGPSLCLNAHTDTVGYAGWPQEALVPRRDGDRLFGLGAADDKGCCAVAVMVLRALALEGPPLKGDLVVACVADEEGVSLGSEQLARDRRFDYAIVLEADALPRVVVEHQGFGWLDIVVYGRAAHGSAPEAGVDAILGLAEVLTRLRAWDRDHFAMPPTPRNGKTVFHTGTVQGGTDYATYPSQATVGIEIGTQPGEMLAIRVSEIEALIAEVADRDAWAARRGSSPPRARAVPGRRSRAALGGARSRRRRTAGSPSRAGRPERLDRRRPPAVGRDPHSHVRPLGRQFPQPLRVGVPAGGGGHGRSRNSWHESAAAMTGRLFSEAAAATCDWLGPLLEEARRFYPVPGGVLSMADPGGTVAAMAFGDDIAGVPMTTDRSFAMGSISKFFTALVVDSVVEEGKLRFDDPIGSLLTWADLPCELGEIPLGALLTHTGGLPLGGDVLPDDAGEIVIARDLGRAGAARRFHYSNLGYLMFGEAVLMATGRPLADHVARRLLSPLGLHSARSQVSHADRETMATGHWTARPDRPWVPGDALEPAPWFELDSASGNVTATASDMDRFGAAVLSAHAGAPMPAG